MHHRRRHGASIASTTGRSDHAYCPHQPGRTQVPGLPHHGHKVPQLGLQVLAQLTPKPHTVEIIDEVFGFDHSDSLIRKGRFDLVGVTSYSSGGDAGLRDRRPVS